MTKRRPLRRRFATIPFIYKRWLLSGRPGALPYLEPARVEALWREHGDTIVQRHVAKRPFSRPANWWKYDAPERHDPTQETEYQYLERHGLLFPSEQPRIKRHVGAQR
jgi:hypothetical protein